MKFWIEAILEDGDVIGTYKKCGECLKVLDVPDHVFCEFELRQGGMPNPAELHPEPTGRIICPDCSVRTLI